MNYDEDKWKDLFREKIKQANLLESKSPVKSYNLLKESFKILQDHKFPLSNREIFEKNLIIRLDYLKKKLRPQLELEKQRLEKLDEEPSLTVDNVDMDVALSRLEDEYIKKQSKIESDANLSEEEQLDSIESLKKWKKEEELTILIQAAGGDSKNDQEEEDFEEEENIPDGEDMTSEESKIADSEESTDIEEFPDEHERRGPSLISLEPTEMEKIWEYYFLHAFRHPTPNEFYGADETEGKIDSKAQEFIMRLLQQAIDHYKKIDSTKILTEFLPGNSKVYYVGSLNGSFEAIDKLLRFFMPKIFEAQATENPLRIVFLGNICGGAPMDFHTLLFLLCFNLLNPNEVIILRGPNEDKRKISRLGLKKYITERLDEEIFPQVQNLFMRLPVAYKIESDYKSLFASHGFLPIDLDNPNNPLLLAEQKLDASHQSIAEIDPISQQIILNQIGIRMKTDTTHQPIKNSKGYKLNQAILQPLLEFNNIDLLVSGSITLQAGFKIYGGNQAIALFSTFEHKHKQVHGKILEVVYPEDSEEEDYEEEDGEEYEEGEDEEEYEEEYEEEDGEDEEEYEEEENGDTLLGEDANLVSVNLLDMDHI